MPEGMARITQLPPLWGLPIPYPDELYWGYLGRIRRNLGMLWARSSNRHLFGWDDIIATTEFSGFAETLCSQLARVQDWTSLDWMQRHTLYPYYLAFADMDDKRTVIKKAEKGSAFGLHQHLNVSSGRIKPPAYLRYCRACWQEQMARLGEVYLRRLFQLPGAFFCPDHQCPLANTDLRYRHIHSREFVCVTIANVGPQQTSPWIDQWFDPLLAIAADSQQLLNEPLNHGESAMDQRWQYRLALRYMGLGKAAIDMEAYERCFLNHYPMPLLAVMNLSFIPGKLHHWLREMIRSPRRRMHPLQHLLFRRFVEAELGKHCWENLGHETWPCFSPISRHAEEDMVVPLQLGYLSSEDRWEGLFQCTCGCRYSAGGPGHPSPAGIKLRRVVGYGASLDRLIRKYAQLGFSKHLIAQTLHIDGSVVDRVIEGPRPDGRAGKLRWNCERDCQAWESLRGLYPKALLKDLRRLDCALYVRLYRHDRSWLVRHQPERSARAGGMRRVSWDERDVELASRVDQEITRLFQLRPMRRVTMTAAGRCLGLVTMLKQKRASLPQTSQILIERCESVEQFQIRRLQDRIKTSRITPGQLARSALLRLAGLNELTLRPATAALIHYYCS